MRNKKIDTSLSVSINQKTFENYFQKSINDLFNENGLFDIGNQTYKELKKLCDENKCEHVDVFIAKYYYKLLDNIQCANPNKTEYYKFVQQYFIQDLLNKPAFFVLLLSSLLNKDFVKYGFLEICNLDVTDVRIRTLVANQNSGLFDKYLDFLKGQFEIANEIFYGVLELAKNIVQHSEEKAGKIIVKSITKESLEKDKDPWKANPELWKDYFAYIKEQKLEFLGNEETYLEISVVDTGTVGIIETSFNNMKNPKNSRKLPPDIIEQDINIIDEGIRSCSNDTTREAELLFDMYFNRGDKFKLNRQARNAYKGLGIQIFTKFITDNYGIFNVETNKFEDKHPRIGFSYRKNSSIKLAAINPNIFGTRYNIIIPLRKGTIKQKNGNEKKTDRYSDILSRGTYERMLPLEREDILQNVSFGELDEYNLPKYVIKNMQTGENKIMVFSLKDKSSGKLPVEIDRCMIFRTISLLFLKNPAAEAVIIKDFPENKELMNGLFKIYTDFELFEENKTVLLIAEEKKEREKKEKSVIAGKEVAVITGESEEECKKINQYISEKNGEFTVFPERCSGKAKKEIAKEEIERIERIKNVLCNQHILFPAGQLIALDFFEQGGDSYFENERKDKLETLLDEKAQGYKWKDTHLKIGSKLHLDDFIYGKKMFQRSGDAGGFAYILSKKIFKKIKEENKEIKEDGKTIYYTLIGYGNYSELLVSRTCGFVEFLLSEDNNNLKEKIKCEYVIVKDEEEIKFSRYIKNFEGRENTIEKLIIIVPISSTLTTCLKIENTFKKLIAEKKYDENIFEVIKPFYTIVVVGDEIRDKRRKKQTDPKVLKDIESYFNDKKNPEKFNDTEKCWINIDDTEKDYYIKEFSAIEKCWTGVKAKKRIILTENREAKAKGESAERENQFNIYIQSKWRLPENCEHCFPENPIKERPLFITDKVSVTPSLIFDELKWYPSAKNCKMPYFKFGNGSIKTELPIIDKIDWVHYKGDGSKHFNYYLHYLDFINENENKKKIKKWANEDIREKYFENDLLRKEKILLITPDKGENGAFTHLINREVFNDEASVIRFDQHSDHYLNFDKFFNDEVNKADKIYFVDNSMFSGKTFLLLDSTLKLLQEGKSINGIFCLNNRMDYYCYNAIARCLQENNKKDNDEKNNEIQHLFSFVDLYIPESVTMPCPLCEEKDKLRKITEKDGSTEKKGLIEETSLDCIKQYFFEKELPYYKIVEKEKLIEGKLPYKPLEKNHDSTLLKVVLIHFLNKAFADNEDFIKPLKTETLSEWEKPKKDFNFNGFVKDFRNYIDTQGQCNINGKDDKGREIINDFKFKANLIKVLSSHSFRKYRGVYISVFYWVLNDLIIAAKTILGEKCIGNYDNVKMQTNYDFSNKSNENEIDKYIDTVNYLRALIKHASLLNIAYLLHQDFIAAVNKLILSFDRKDIETLEKNINMIADSDLSRKFKEMRYSFENFKIFCAAHIISSLYKNEQRAIRFEKNINAVLKEKKDKDTSFFDLLILENTSIIKQILKNHSDTKNLIDDNLDDFHSFMKKTEIYDENSAFIKLKQAHEIQQKIKEYEKSPETKYGKDDKDIKYIMKNIAGIVGCSEKSGKGILLYKYQSSKNKTEDSNKEAENYAVVGEYGDEKTLSSYFETPLLNSFATEFLEGINYLTETLYSEKTQIDYKWTSCALYKNKNDEWTGQDGKQTINIESKECKYSGFVDIKSLNEKANRILFIRISGYHTNKKRKDDEEEETLKGEAVFVLYDNEEENKGKRPDSVHNTRFVHILRNEISEYLKKKYRNDAFRAWVEVENKIKEYVNRYNKNTHGAYKYFREFVKSNKKIIVSNPYLMAMCADLVIGEIHYSLLAFKQKEFSATEESIGKCFNEDFINCIKSHLENEGFAVSNLTIKIPESIKIHYAFETQFLVFQFINNIVIHTEKNEHKNANISILTDNEHIIIKNSNSNITPEKAKEINIGFESDNIPFGSVSLYVINHFCTEMYKRQENCKKIKIEYEDNNTFVVKIPLITNL